MNLFYDPPTYISLKNVGTILKIKKLTQKNCCPKFLLVNLTIQLVKKATSQIGHVKNDLTKMTKVIFWLVSNKGTFWSKFPVKKVMICSSDHM
jgi:hypothetical protein